ncbi:site-specific DNA-methyltransferase [Thiopseudomonas sp. 4R-3cl]|nr:site-specific DNA-methyltransferase [Thiopseudomonas sp. 4R-3cl]
MDFDDYIEMIAEFQQEKLAIIHYPEETMMYFVTALGIPDEVNVWAYNSNLPSRHSRLINYYNVKPDYNKVLQPYKNPTDKRIQERIKKGRLGARSYDWFTDIQLVKNVEKTEYPHPCPVPVELMERIILLTTNEGDVIFDPFMGSGTTAIAAVRTGRKYVGFELSENYCKVAEERIQNELSKETQLGLIF